ncbi:TPA: hypothetical protein ACH3X2_012624 [Trebouxia sp. C0005]|nr:MAG: hypothetical protein FRX49_01640 [Trebouxia sp. A1-2]
MRATWPAEFDKIVDGLLPGMLDLLQQVEQRGKQGLSKEESRVSAHVYSGLFFMAAFLQLSAWKLYEHPNSSIYRGVPLFREVWFRAFHLEQYCPKVRSFQHMAEAVSQHILDPNNSCNNVLIRARQQLQMPFNTACTTAQSMRILMCAYTLATGKAVSDTDAVAEPKAAAASSTELQALPVGEHEVCLQDADGLKSWWHTWDQGHKKYQPLRNYFSGIQAAVGKEKWVHDDHRKRFQRTKQMLLELEKQIAQGHQKKEANADRVIKRWDAVMALKRPK